jgi:hypothetical protein
MATRVNEHTLSLPSPLRGGVGGGGALYEGCHLLLTPLPNPPPHPPSPEGGLRRTGAGREQSGVR